MQSVAGARVPNNSPRILAAGLGGLGWFALAVQFYFNIEEALIKDLPISGNIIRYFSYFTIETNLIIALALTMLCARPRAAHFLTRPSVTSALVVYIIVVGAVYAVLLRHLWHPAGLQFFADIVLHDAISFLYPLYWLIFLPKGGLRWNDPFWWLVYPALYFVYSMIRAAILDTYPYPFLDVSQLGLAMVLVNAALLLVVFLVLGLALVAIDRALSSDSHGRSRLGRTAEL
ncbi:MAG: Pr6Pr family membrane protein [Beijerinckiaceae bacterium]|nr:Pr6Pr family membrane protein [Beijerinckiaceae bacterium]MCI0736993.1 Pr6Pr family membrane protein [Beijerinckiaceae bacterium]